MRSGRFFTILFLLLLSNIAGAEYVFHNVSEVQANVGYTAVASSPDGVVVVAWAVAGEGVFGLVPMDNSQWCKGPQCQAELNREEESNQQFNNGRAANYIFNFTNKVAREVGKTHPGRWIGQNRGIANYARTDTYNGWFYMKLVY